MNDQKAERHQSTTIFPPLAGKLALVTGAGQGNGRSIAIGLAEAGANVVVTDINAENLLTTVRDIRAIGRQAWHYQWDIADETITKTIGNMVNSEVGEIDILVNNAGVIHRGNSDDPGAFSAWRRVLSVNLDGTYYATIAFLPALKRTKGCVINVGSVQSFVSLSTISAAYGASKGAINMLTKKHAIEFAPFGIRVNAIAPGYIQTPINAAIETDPAELSRRLERVPLGRFGQPEEIVGTTVFLAAEQHSGYITGVTIPIDGGLLAL